MAIKGSEVMAVTYSGPKVVEPASLLNAWVDKIGGFVPWFQNQRLQITQLFGPTDFTHEPPGFGVPHFHDGIDIAGMVDGTNLLSAINGTIDHIGYDPHGFGNYITVIPSYDPTKLILFGHLKDTKSYDQSQIKSLGGIQSQPQWQVGQGIRVGDILGHVNSTGNSTGTHLHMSVYDTAGGGKTPIDPIDWLFLAPSRIGPGGTGTTPSSVKDSPSGFNDFLDSLFFPNSTGAKRFGSSGKKLIFTILGVGMMGLAVILYFKPKGVSLSLPESSPRSSQGLSVEDVQEDSAHPQNTWNSTGLYRSYSGVSARGMRERYGNRNHKTRTVRLARR